MSTKSEFRLKGRHVLIMFLGFFGVMTAVNAVFLITAVNTFPGDHVDGAYERGLAYNAVLEARNAQTQAGWTAEISQARLTQNVLDLSVQLNAASPSEPTPDEVTVQLRHPVNSSFDVSAQMSMTSTDLYTVALDPVHAALWDVEITAFTNGVEVMTATARLDLRAE